MNGEPAPEPSGAGAPGPLLLGVDREHVECGAERAGALGWKRDRERTQASLHLATLATVGDVDEDGESPPLELDRERRPAEKGTSFLRDVSAVHVSHRGPLLQRDQGREARFLCIGSSRATRSWSVPRDRNPGLASRAPGPSSRCGESSRGDPGRHGPTRAGARRADDGHRGRARSLRAHRRAPLNETSGGGQPSFDGACSRDGHRPALQRVRRGNDPARPRAPCSRLSGETGRAQGSPRDRGCKTVEDDRALVRPRRGARPASWRW